MSLSGIIHHSHSFTRLEIYHHIYFKMKIITFSKVVHMVFKLNFCESGVLTFYARFVIAHGICSAGCRATFITSIIWRDMDKYILETKMKLK